MDCTSSRQRGVSLVESLVALVVLSVGMLGIASLYVTSLKAGRTALTRTQAVTLVNDMLDRVRANSRARGAYKLTTTAAPTPSGCSDSGGCSAAQLANDDLASWRTAVVGTLPGAATGEVDFGPAGGTGFPDEYTVTVSWQEAGEPAPFTYRASTRLAPVRP